MPPRLGDPLAFTRNSIFASAAVSLALALALACALFSGSDHLDQNPFGDWLLDNAGWVTAPIVVAASYVLLCWPLLLILPFRRTNAFYLRAFRGDDQTAPLRQAIIRGLGRGYRLSGIRAPSRRSSVFLRHLFLSFHCLRYSGVKHMNLEAEEDWFARLWTSLGDARCAFVDLTDLTEYVSSEVALVYGRLGPRRVMFLGDATRTESDWRALAASRLGIGDEGARELSVVTWERGPGRDLSGLIAQVREFAGQIPAGTASGDTAGSAPGEDPPPWTPTDRRRRIWRGAQALAGFLCIPSALSAINYVSMASTNVFGDRQTTPLNRSINTAALILLGLAISASLIYLLISSFMFFLDNRSKVARTKAALLMTYYVLMLYPLYLLIVGSYRATFTDHVVPLGISGPF